MQYQALVLLFTLLICPTVGHSQPTCDAPALSDAEVTDAVETARATRTDLPSLFPKYRSSVRKRGCYYTYIEFPIPEELHANNIFTLNQHGAIVDVIASARMSGMECPSREFTESELAEIVRAEREKRSDLPPPFENFRPYVERLRCLYLYFEHKVPQQRGDYQVFTIDPLGGLMEFSRNEPY